MRCCCELCRRPPLSVTPPGGVLVGETIETGPLTPLFLNLTSLFHINCSKVNKGRQVEGCLAVKADYQWRLLPGENMLDALDSRHCDVAPAICQVRCHMSLSHVACICLNMCLEDLSISKSFLCLCNCFGW